jgi:hypothetical protein
VGELEQRGYCHLLLLRGRGEGIDLSNNMYDVAQYDLTQETEMKEGALDPKTPWTVLVNGNSGLVHRIYKVYGSKPLGALEVYNEKPVVLRARAEDGEVRYLYGYSPEEGILRICDPLYPDNRNYTLNLSMMTYMFRLRTFHIKEMYQ